MAAPLALLSAALLAAPVAVQAARLSHERPERDAWSSCGDDAACAAPSPQPVSDCGAVSLLQRSASLMRGGRVLRSIGGRDVAGLLSAEPDDDSDLAALFHLPGEDAPPAPVPAAAQAAGDDSAELAASAALFHLPGEDAPPAPVPAAAQAAGDDSAELAASVPGNTSSGTHEPAAQDAGVSNDWLPALGFVSLGEVPETTSMALPMIPPFAASTMQASTTTTTSTAVGSLLYNANSTNTIFTNHTDLFAPGNSSAWELLGRTLPSRDLMIGKAEAAVVGLTTEAVVSTLASRAAGLSRMAKPLPAAHWANFEDAFGTANVSEEQALAAAADLALLWNTDMASAARRDANSTKSSAVPANLLDECEAGLAAIAKISGGKLPQPDDGFDVSTLHWRGFCAQLAQRLAAAFDEADARKAQGSKESLAQGRRQALAAPTSRPRVEASGSA